METSTFNTLTSIEKDDQYEIYSIVYDDDGAKIVLKGINFSYEIVFGAISALNICDEGVRIKSYNEITEIQDYRKNKFKGIPIFEISGTTPYKQFIADESCGFSDSLLFFAIVTLNHFIEIANPFPPVVRQIKL